jgi:predicted nuclease with TOPRIM domain
MDNITVTFNTILQLFGAIAVVGGGVKILVNLFNPFRNLKAEVEAIRGFLDRDNQRLKEGDKRMKELDEKIDKLDDAMSEVGLAMSELMEHMISGNDVDELRKRQKRLNEYFYKGKEKEHE